jgi:hypothetical protein
MDAAAADVDDVVVLELAPLDDVAVDVGAVGAVEVFDLDLAGRAHVQQRMLAAHRGVVDDDVVVGAAPERRPVLGERHLPDHGPLDRDDHFRHRRVPDG